MTETAHPPSARRDGTPAPDAHARLAPVLEGMIAAVRSTALRVAASGHARSLARDEEAVHDFRVALRRLRTTLRVARRVYRRKRVLRIEEEIRRHADATGASTRAATPTATSSGG